ncbi:substrate-binding domain-containing protein [Micrococcales bacterium 31B]|nr:substrate-binding domain-containing protein [Micrococcales bacterium 31B]
MANFTTRVLAVSTAALLALGGLTACGGDSGGAGGGGGEVKVGLITKTDSNPYFVKLKEEAQKEATAKGATLISAAGKFDGDNDAQVAAIENMVAQGVKGILITPNSSSGIIDAIKKARDQGVVVIALDTATEPADAVDATLATDNKQAGVLQGKWVKATFGDGDAKVLLMNGTPGTTVDNDRKNGFIEGFGLSGVDDPAIVGTADANGDQAKALSAAQNLVQAHPDVNVFYTMNEPMSRGVVQALDQAGIKDKVVVGSIDGSCAGVQAVKDGQVGATVMQFPAKMATQGVDAVVKYAADGTKPSGFIDTGSQLITDKPVDGLESQDSTWGLENCWG